jgi:hypothetical protein
MKDLTGTNIKALQGNSRLITIKGEEAIIFEKYKDYLSIYVCVLDDSVIKSFFAFHELRQQEVLSFLEVTDKGRTLTTGIRVGPLNKGSHLRRIVILKNKKKDNATHFIKVEPLTTKDADWENNGSGWVPVTNLSHKAPGLVVFIRDVQQEDLIEISPVYTETGIFFLHEKYEVYVENVMKSYAFGKLIPRQL